jgi:hypothetical protein
MGRHVRLSPGAVVLSLLLAACGGGGRTVVGVGGADGTDASVGVASTVPDGQEASDEGASDPFGKPTAFVLRPDGPAGARLGNAAYLPPEARVALLSLAARTGGTPRLPAVTPRAAGDWDGKLRGEFVISGDSFGLVWHRDTMEFKFAARPLVGRDGRPPTPVPDCSDDDTTDERWVDIAETVRGCLLVLRNEGTNATWLSWDLDGWSYGIQEEPLVSTSEELIDLAATMVPVR